MLKLSPCYPRAIQELHSDSRRCFPSEQKYEQQSSRHTAPESTLDNSRTSIPQSFCMHQLTRFHTVLLEEELGDVGD